MTDAEKKLEHIKELGRIRNKRFIENHKLVSFCVKLTGERYEQLTNALKDKGITQKQFVEDAIDRLLKS